MTIETFFLTASFGLFAVATWAAVYRKSNPIALIAAGLACLVASALYPVAADEISAAFHVELSG